MKKGFIYFLCVSFLLMMNGFPIIRAEAKDKVIPIGEMVSKGEVQFEVRENVWRGVESSHFPVFRVTRIKTEQGNAIVTLLNNSQVGVNPNSLFSFDQNDRFILSKGSIEFRIPSSGDIDFKVGNLSILRSRAPQANKDPLAVSPKNEETIGSISIHSNGSVTVKNIQGKLSILSQDRVVLAALSSNESVTVPSVTVGGPSRVMVAQVAETAAAAGAGGAFGLSTTALVVIGVVAAAAVGVGVAVSVSPGGTDMVPLCP